MITTSLNSAGRIIVSDDSITDDTPQNFTVCVKDESDWTEIHNYIINENNIDNFSLILFYSTHCQHCQNIIPIMKQLPGTVTGCQFGMINVSKNKKTIRMSKNTITPLTYVPYIILYYNRFLLISKYLHLSYATNENIP